MLVFNIYASSISDQQLFTALEEIKNGLFIKIRKMF